MHTVFLIAILFNFIPWCFAKEAYVANNTIYKEIIDTAEKENWQMAYADSSSDNKNIYVNYFFKTKQKYLLLKDNAMVSMRFDPTLSHNGKKVAFWLYEYEHKKTVLYVVNYDGTGKTNLLEIATAGGIAWSPDGKKIAFASGNIERKVDSALYVVDVETKVVSKIITDGIDYLSHQAWSPKGDQIVYDYQGKIIIYDFKQKKSVSLCEGLAPIWSPVNNEILYYDKVKKSLNLLRMDNNENFERRVVGEELISSKELGDGQIVAPLYWFPDGKYIFIGHLSPSETEIGIPYVMKIESREFEKLSDVSWVFWFFSTWAKP